MESTVNNIKLLLTSQFNEVNRIAGYTNCKLWIVFWVFHSIHQLFAVKYVHVQVMCLAAEVSIHHRYKVGFAGFAVFTKRLRHDGECIRDTVQAVLVWQFCN
ncbi:hypothetical protein D3C80_1882320 [compost metagenome]